MPPLPTWPGLQLELRLDQHQQSPPGASSGTSAGSTSVSEMNDRSPTIEVEAASSGAACLSAGSQRRAH